MQSNPPDTAPGQRPVVATACGKLILLGEHAVVYGEPAVALPLPGLRLSVVLSPGESGFGGGILRSDGAGGAPLTPSQSGPHGRGMMPRMGGGDSPGDLSPITPMVAPALPVWDRRAAPGASPASDGIELGAAGDEGLGASTSPSETFRSGDSALRGGTVTLDMPAVGAHDGTPLVVEVGTDAPEGARAGVSRALAAVSQALGLALPLPLRVAVRSGGLRSGMGTSAALGTALARALLAWYGDTPEPSRVLAAAEAVEELFHGRPSGIDHTVSVWEAPIWFEKGKEPTPLSGFPQLSLVVRPRASRASTAEIVHGVKDRMAAHPELVRVVADLGRRTREGRQAWARGDWAGLAGAMTAQQEGLDRLGVVHEDDRAGCAAALGAGALAAKITGAGWGGTLIALVRPGDEELVVAAWGAGSQVILAPA